MSPSFLERVKRTLPLRILYRYFPWVFVPYHYILALAAAWWYDFPSKKMVVIGVTGTKGKTTTCNILAQILQNAGRKTGLATSVNFRIGDREWVNETKQTMLGRFSLQALLREMVSAGCRYAVIETSSEGILQNRHRFIDYRVAVFTNITPEHIERHGSFENYQKSKLKLFRQVARRPDGIGVFNLDDPNVGMFLLPPIRTKYGIAIRDRCEGESQGERYRLENFYEVYDIRLGINRTRFRIGKNDYAMSLIGEPNVYNATAAVATCFALGLPLKRIRDGLLAARAVPGRFEIVNLGQPFTVVIDYAHEPASLEAIYKAVELFKPKRIIGLLGAQGGGRDRWKRGAMGKLAAQYCAEIVLTNEDPYDEDPLAIIEDLKKGVDDNAGEFKPVYKIPDRREGIRRALLLAKKGDAVVLTGKGGEIWMAVEGGRKIIWNERQTVEDIIAAEPEKFLWRSGRSTHFDED